MFVAIKGKVNAVYRLRQSDVKKVTEYLKDIPYQLFGHGPEANKWVGVDKNHVIEKFSDCIKKLKDLNIISGDIEFSSKNKKENKKLKEMQLSYEQKAGINKIYVAIKGNFKNVYSTEKSNLPAVEGALKGISHATFKTPSKAFGWLGTSEDEDMEDFNTVIEKLNILQEAKENSPVNPTKLTKKQNASYYKAKTKENIEEKKKREIEHEVSLDTYSTDYPEGTRTSLVHYMTAGGDKYAFGIFKGQVSNIDKSWGTCFANLYVEFDEMGERVQAKEEHVWVVNDEEFMKAGIKIGDCVEFNAIANAYKRKNGTIDFGLKSPENIKKISSYELPDDYTLLLQSLRCTICDVCLYREHCYGFCMASREWFDDMMLNLMSFARVPREYFERYIKERFDKEKMDWEKKKPDPETSKKILKSFYDSIAYAKTALDEIISSDFKVNDKNVIHLEKLLQEFGMDARMRDAIVMILEPYYKQKKESKE